MKKIAVVVLEGAMSSSIGDLPDIAHTANIFIGERLGKNREKNRLIDNKPARFIWEFLSLDGRAPPGATTSLLHVKHAIADATESYDLVFVPALSYSMPSTLLRELSTLSPLYAWLRDQWQNGAVIASICTGTLILAEAGLLDNRAATTASWMEAFFRQRYPRVGLDTSRDITEQDRVYCAAMLGSNTRLSLLLMARFLPSDISNLLYKSVVGNAAGAVLPPRVLLPGNAEAALGVSDELVAQAQYWFQKHISEKVTLADAADHMLVSGKTLERHFKKTLGITPHTYLKRIRMDSAKSLLLHSDLSIEIIAERAGYRDPAFFERIFRKHSGYTPTRYRKTFGRAS